MSYFDCRDKLKFDEYLLQRMIEKTKNLEILNIVGLKYMEKSSRHTFLKSISGIIASNKNNSITELNFAGQKSNVEDGTMIL